MTTHAQPFATPAIAAASDPIPLPRKVLVLGSGALKIGEAGEFDYSGSQAIKALKDEGIRTILINPNIATIQTSEDLADEVYFLPVTPEFAEKLIARERPDGLLLAFGGQTALNCGVELERRGVLAKYGAKVYGTSVQAILDTEDRARFASKLDEIGVKTPRGMAAETVERALEIAEEIGYPVMTRVAFALGGLGSGACFDAESLRAKAQKALAHAPQMLVEEYLLGWKEVEYEIVRDRFDNAIAVCNMENLDPLGIHTGESVVVAPSQTLSNSEYHRLREIALRVARHLGILGECNAQFALDPKSEDYRVIEVNARLSRSSALASKATGYPLAYVAAKLALGRGLHELPNAVTRSTTAMFEPALDYCVVKAPRWDTGKFRMASRQIGSAMKSVGEVMAIGRSFEEAIQKALRMLNVGALGLVANDEMRFDDLEEELRRPTERRVFAIARALRAGYTVDRVHELTHIDRWFLHKIERVARLGDRLEAVPRDAPFDRELMRDAKRAGFSDAQIARLSRRKEADVRRERRALGLVPAIRQIDTLAAEYPAQTNYLYLTYHGEGDDIAMPGAGTSVLVLGSGAYCVGSSVEFDWCCVNAVRALRKLGWKTAMLNFNPETVSTDYDESDLLFFDEISLENVLEIAAKLRPRGTIVSMGGQIPNNLALKLHREGVAIIGTHAESIDQAEDRRKFSGLLDEIGVDQPEWSELRSLDEARDFAKRVGFPVLARPSYVLSGAAMAVACDDEELERYLERAADVSEEHPVVVTKFLENAKEIEFDAVARGGELLAYAISEHVEHAGVHSGDATLVLPAQFTFLETARRVRMIGRKIAERLKIDGVFNIQFLSKRNDVKVIECNLRASRSFPFVSKVTRTNFIELAVRSMMGEPVKPVEGSTFELDYVGVKAPQFSFTRLDGADPVTGVEMASTGEVACLGRDFDEAFLKALVAVGYRLPIRSILLSTGSVESKAELLEACRLLARQGIALYATLGTRDFLAANGVATSLLLWPGEQGGETAIDAIHAGKLDLVVNIPKNFQREELTMDYLIRRAAVDFKVPLMTNRQVFARLAEALSRTDLEDLAIEPWSAYSPAKG